MVADISFNDQQRQGRTRYGGAFPSPSPASHTATRTADCLKPLAALAGVHGLVLSLTADGYKQLEPHFEPQGVVLLPLGGDAAAAAEDLVVRTGGVLQPLAAPDQVLLALRPHTNRVAGAGPGPGPGKLVAFSVAAVIVTVHWGGPSLAGPQGCLDVGQVAAVQRVAALAGGAQPDPEALRQLVVVRKRDQCRRAGE